MFGVQRGEDISPEVLWGTPPADTKSFVVTCYDPDSPTISGFLHWAVIDNTDNMRGLPTDAGNPIRSDSLPTCVFMLKNDAGLNVYVGAGPPEGHGSHRCNMFAVSAMPVEELGIDAK